MGFTHHIEGNEPAKESKKNMNTTMKLMKQAREIKSPKHFQLLFGKFQKATKHLSIDLQDSAIREFRRVAQTGWDNRNFVA